jgi:hypothetical protein
MGLDCMFKIRTVCVLVFRCSPFVCWDTCVCLVEPEPELTFYYYYSYAISRVRKI